MFIKSYATIPSPTVFTVFLQVSLFVAAAHFYVKSVGKQLLRTSYFITIASISISVKRIITCTYVLYNMTLSARIYRRVFTRLYLAMDIAYNNHTCRIRIWSCTRAFI